MASSTTNTPSTGGKSSNPGEVIFKFTRWDDLQVDGDGDTTVGDSSPTARQQTTPPSSPPTQQSPTCDDMPFHNGPNHTHGKTFVCESALHGNEKVHSCPECEKAAHGLLTTEQQAIINHGGVNVSLCGSCGLKLALDESIPPCFCLHAQTKCTLCFWQTLRAMEEHKKYSAETINSAGCKGCGNTLDGTESITKCLNCGGFKEVKIPFIFDITAGTDIDDGDEFREFFGLK